jgi:hypothetical protein
MDTIYTINVFKISNIYIIKNFKLPDYSEQQNVNYHSAKDRVASCFIL